MSYACLLVLLVHLANAQSPIQINWSSDHYGPDGPWNAVNVSIGSNNQNVALFPGSLRNFQVLSSSMCDGIPTGQTCFPNLAGTYNENTSTTDRINPVPPFIQGLSWDAPIPSHQNETSLFEQVRLGYINEQPLANMSVWSLYNADLILPNGTRYQPTVGLFSYGSPPYDSSGALTNDPIGGNPPTQLYARGLIPSASFGLHYGSVNPYIPPSLYFGGYDQSRALGTVSGQQYLLNGQGSLGKGPVKLQIDLADIGLGVAHGGSPFSAPSIDGLLASGNSSMGSAVSVRPGGNAPYLHLPRSTCDAIAKELPVTFRPDLGLYLWNVDDPQYKRIVTSPSYLSFTFRTTQNNTDQFTIKVPFMLLNLSLTQPLMSEPTPYFPCSPLDYDVYVLGRAFLQAAFFGANWLPADAASAGAGYWWLAQAPGPGTSLNPTITSISNDTMNLTGDTSDWASTWDGYWTPLPEVDPGLSTGAQAGIGVGVAVAGLLVIAGLIFFCLRRRKQKQNSRRGTVASSHLSEAQLKEDEIVSPSSAAETPPATNTAEDQTQWRHEMEETSSPRVELGAITAKHEMEAGEDGKGPGVGGRLNPAEVGADGEFERHELATNDHRTPEPPSSPVELDAGHDGTFGVQNINEAQEQSKGKETSWPLPEQPLQPQEDEDPLGHPSPPEPSPPIDEAEKRRLWRRYNGAG